MTQVLDWPSAADSRDLVRQVVEVLARGGTVALPTEAVYTVMASALRVDAIQRLVHARGRPLSVAVRSGAEALDWVPGMGVIGQRLARRCWPGPVTLSFDGVESRLTRRLPEEVRQHINSAGNLRLRSPAHEAIQSVLQVFSEPLACGGAHREGALPAVTAEQVAEGMGDVVDLILDDGPSFYGQPATVVQVNGTSWSVVRPGVLSEDVLRRQTAFLVIFVCTGNTCRSPLAEALCKQLLAERLRCAPADLAERGFLVISAGLTAMIGGGAASEAIEVARELGADLGSHRSQVLTRDLAARADCLVGMTKGHLLAMAQLFPDLLDRSRLLRSDGLDIADPIGSAQEVYKECAAEIGDCLKPLVAEWLAA
jgi:protein-tyrosine phosphatase